MAKIRSDYPKPLGEMFTLRKSAYNVVRPCGVFSKGHSKLSSYKGGRMEETREQTTDILHAKSETPHRMELYQNEEKCFKKKIINLKLISKTVNISEPCLHYM